MGSPIAGVDQRRGECSHGLEALEEVFAEEQSGAPRVLLVASDRRFRSVAAALLQRRGYVGDSRRAGLDDGRGRCA